MPPKDVNQSGRGGGVRVDVNKELEVIVKMQIKKVGVGLGSG